MELALVLALRDTLAIPTRAVSLNVYLIQIVQQIWHAHKTNVMTHVLERVVLMRYAKL